jgi:hypothetical protein
MERRSPPAQPRHGQPAEQPSELPARDRALSARALVAALWYEAPPIGAGGTGETVPTSVAELRAALARLSTRAESCMVLTAGPPVDEVSLLGETARALHTMLDDAAHVGGRDVLLRVARLERWLTHRAEQEPVAECASHLALWVLEHLEKTTLE